MAVTVTDEGPGISPARAVHVFEAFYTTKPKGTGLGLAICRRIAVAHGGHLRVEAHPGPGARLRLELPVGARPAIPLTPAPSADGAGLQPARGGNQVRTWNSPYFPLIGLKAWA